MENATSSFGVIAPSYTIPATKSPTSDVPIPILPADSDAILPLLSDYGVARAMNGSDLKAP